MTPKAWSVKKKKKKEINKCHKNSTLLLSEGHCSENNFLSHRLGEDTCKLHIWQRNFIKGLRVGGDFNYKRATWGSFQGNGTVLCLVYGGGYNCVCQVT